MNWIKQKKLLKRLFNNNYIFFKHGEKWYFETCVEKNEETIKLIKEYIAESQQNNK